MTEEQEEEEEEEERALISRESENASGVWPLRCTADKWIGEGGGKGDERKRGGPSQAYVWLEMEEKEEGGGTGLMNVSCVHYEEWKKVRRLRRAPFSSSAFPLKCFVLNYCTVLAPIQPFASFMLIAPHQTKKSPT